MNPITIETFTEFRFVSNPSFSPDGKQIAFVVQQADLKDNAYHGDLYLYDVQEKTVRQATSSGDVKSYTWTKAGTLLFPSGREKKKTDEAGDRTVYYELLPDGGEVFYPEYESVRELARKSGKSYREVYRVVKEKA